MAAAIHQRREQEHAPLVREEVDIKQWFINPKTPKLFELFNGKADQYRSWSQRVKDHLMSNTLAWGRLLEVVEKERHPLTRARLANMSGVDEASIANTIGTLLVLEPAQRFARIQPRRTRLNKPQA